MRGIARRTQRIAAYVASGALAVSGSILALSPAEAVTYDPAPANQAADWLATQFDAQNLIEYGDNGADVGLTIDGVFALLSAGGHDAKVSDAADAIQGENGYIEYTYSIGPDTYAGRAANATAKVMALFQTISPAKSTMGGVNLQTRLESLVATASPIQGRLVDFSTKNGTPDGQDYANTLGQSYAAHALDAVGSDKTAAVTDFLLKQQCASGFFRLGFSAKSASNQSCVEGTDAPDTDATAIAVLELQAQSADRPAVAAAIAKAKAWLTSRQRCDGSFGGGTATEASNANSTGLAAAAIGDSPAARQAAQALKALQIPQSAGSPQQNARGAIALNAKALADSRVDGVNVNVVDQFRRATAQAILGIKWYSSDATPDLTLTAPGGYHRAGTSAVLTSTGAAQGTVLCITGSGASVRGIADANGLRSTVKLPSGTGFGRYTVKDAYGHVASAGVHVLGKKNLRVTKSRYRVKRKRLVTATVHGLAPGEWSRIYYKGRFVRSGHASRGGTFTATFRAGRAKGKRTIQGFGQFTDIRRGATKIKVVR